jgi:hypothetical protein
MESEVNREPTDGQSIENDQLHFQYRMIMSNSALREVAMQTIAKERNLAVSLDRLFKQTFAALRKDGILSLLDDETDTYLFISRERVLEPYCKKLLQKSNGSSLERRVLRDEQPAYLRNVTSARLQYVKKKLIDNH